MSLTKQTQDVAIHQQQVDEPNDVGGLTPAQFKALCDAAAIILNNYINNTLTTEIDTALLAKANITDLQNVILGQIINGTITDPKLSDDPADIKSRFNAHSTDFTKQLKRKQLGVRI